jgi:hypothetical protein
MVYEDKILTPFLNQEEGGETPAPEEETPEEGETSPEGEQPSTE